MTTVNNKQNKDRKKENEKVMWIDKKPATLIGTNTHVCSYIFRGRVYTGV